MTDVLIALYWLLVVAIVFPYLLYPVTLWVIARVRGAYRPLREAPQAWPRVSLIISCAWKMPRRVSHSFIRSPMFSFGQMISILTIGSRIALITNLSLPSMPAKPCARFAQDSAPPDALAAYVKSEIVRWGDVVRKAGAAGIE